MNNSDHFWELRPKLQRFRDLPTDSSWIRVMSFHVRVLCVLKSVNNWVISDWLVVRGNVIAEDWGNRGQPDSE